MMVDCTSFNGVWIITVYSGVLMVATAILPLINFEVFPVIYLYDLIQYVNLGDAGHFFWGFWGKCGYKLGHTSPKVMVSKTPSTQLSLLAWRDQASG